MKSPFTPVIARLSVGCLLLPFAAPASAQSLTDLAPTPPMGWNSWNWHGKAAINEQVVVETIDAIVATGLRDAGYQYVVVDGGWRAKQLNPDGGLEADAVKFPRGMKYLADYAHAHGLKFGVHSVPGTRDCGGDPVGGYGHEDVQARQFEQWGFDFVKMDKCRYETGWNEELLKQVYQKWSGLLHHAPRPIVLSISAYAFRDWYPGTGEMARTTPDILGRVSGGPGAVFDQAKGKNAARSVMAVAELNNRAAASAGHGYWNDPDMMVTGGQGLTPDEEKAHFALWCIMTAPLMLGDDPRHLTSLEKDILLNRDCIAVDQDPTEQGRHIRTDGNIELWLKKLRDGRAAVVLLNRDAEAAHDATLGRDEVPISGPALVRDLYARKDIGALDKLPPVSLPPHGVRFLLVSGGSSAR